MAQEEPPVVSKWRIFVENAILTSYYRVLSFVSIHCPITEAYEACLWLSQNTPLGGEVYYLIPDRLFVWEDVVVNKNPENPVKMVLRAFGSPIRGANTVFTRAGWFFMYTTGPIVDRILGWIGQTWENLVGWR